MDVFICHASEDYEVAQSLCHLLHFNGINYWIAEQYEFGGQSYIQGITDALDQCKVLLLLCSETAMRSKDVKREIFYAYENNIPIVPVMLGAVSLPKETAYILGALHRLTYAANELFCAELITAIRRELQVPARPTKSVPLPRVANHKIAWWVAAIAIVAVVALVVGLLLGRNPAPQPDGDTPAITTTTSADNGTTTTTTEAPTTTTTTAAVGDNEIPPRFDDEIANFDTKSSATREHYTKYIRVGDEPLPLNTLWTNTECYSGNTAVATIDKGEVTAVSKGETFVVIWAGGNVYEIFKIIVY